MYIPLSPEMGSIILSLMLLYRWGNWGTEGSFICSSHRVRRWGNWCLKKWPDFRIWLLSSPPHWALWRQFLALLWIRRSSLGLWASQIVLVIKNTHTSAGDIRDTGSIPGSGRSPAGGHSNPSSTLAWRIPWTEECEGLQSAGVTESQTRLKWLSTHLCPGLV